MIKPRFELALRYRLLDKSNRAVYHFRDQNGGKKRSDKQFYQQQCEKANANLCVCVERERQMYLARIDRQRDMTVAVAI